MTDPNIKKWENYFLDIGISREIIDTYLPFIRTCIDKGIPPIFEIDHLSLLLGLNIDTLTSMVHGSENFYRLFKLKKRSGGFRVIRAPYPSLLEAQRWINDTILSTVSLPNCVTGFRKGYSILDNARMHCGREELLKIDIKDFFPSINFNRVMYVFIGLGYPQNVAFLLSRLCTLEDQLPQGAATSPTLSNIICRNMDRHFYKVCKKFRLRYTQYADDIAISGKKIPEGVRRLFFEIIESENFEINKNKVRFLNSKDRKIVTGLDISSGIPRVTRSYRREIQKDVYFVWSAGLSTHVARRKIFAPNYIEQLEGRIRFWQSVERESPQLLKTLQRMNDLRAIYAPKRH